MSLPVIMRSSFVTTIGLVLSVLLYPAGFIQAQQSLNIDGDTIRVSKKAFARLRFMYEPSYTLLCEGYGVTPDGQILTIRPLAGAESGCRLLVDEGSKSAPRQHKFVLILDKNVDADDQEYDYSTKELIRARVKYLEAAHAASGETAAPEPPAEEPKSKPKLSLKKPSAKKPEVKAPEAKAPEVKAPEVKAPEVKPPTAKKPEVKAPAKAAATKTAVEETSDEAGGSRSSESTGKTSSKSTSGSTSSESEKGEEKVMNIPEEQIKERVDKKIKDFYRVCNALVAGIDADRTTDRGIKVLFNSDESKKVGTTNARTGIQRSMLIRAYFGNLVALGKKYGEVKMTASEINFVSNFKYNEETGLWYGTAVVLQDFVATKDYKVVYKDRTSKAVEIILQVFEEVKDGQTVERFEIFLGNISVTNTPD